MRMFEFLHSLSLKKLKWTSSPSLPRGFNKVPQNHTSKAMYGSTSWNPLSVTTPWISFGGDVSGQNPPVQILSPQQGPNIPSVPPHLSIFTLTITSTGTAYKNSTEVPVFRIKCFNVSAWAGVKSSFWMRQHKTQNVLKFSLASRLHTSLLAKGQFKKIRNYFRKFVTLCSSNTKILALTTGKMTSWNLHGTQGLKKNLFSGPVIFTFLQ